jgi:glutaredoxin
MAMPEQVSVYYHGTCAECRRARDAVARIAAEQGLELRLLDIEMDVDARDQLIRISGQIGAPVVVVDKREIVGLDPRRLKLYLGADADVGPDHRAHW